MSFGPNPWQQAHWDWRAAGNFVCGGAGSGLLLFAALSGARGSAATLLVLGALALVALGLLCAGGIYLMLRPRTFDLVLGLTLLSYAVNLFIFFMGRLRTAAAPILDGRRVPDLAGYADPLPQALVLTAIVISFAMTALLLVIALRARAEAASDHVDGQEPATVDAAEKAS